MSGRKVCAVAALMAFVLSGCGQVQQSGTAPSITTMTTVTPANTPAHVSTPPSKPLPASESAASSELSPMPTTQMPPAGLAVTEADRQAAAAAVAGMSATQKAASVMMPIADLVQGSIGEMPYGGVILMGKKGTVNGAGDSRPADIRQFVDTLQQEASGQVAPLLVATDQEYGSVTRLQRGFTDFPSAEELRAIQPHELAVANTEKAAAAAGSELRAVGVTVDFAPVADVLPARETSALADRSYGSDPAEVAAMVAAAVRGYQSAGVAATLKHFPGIGRSSTDTHKALATLKMDCSSWAETEYVAFRAGLDAHAALVMTGHAAIPAAVDDELPASISPTVVGSLLRGKGISGCPGLGFGGVAVTDSMLMAPIANVYSSGEAAWRALAAGEDLVLMPRNPQEAVAGIVSAVQDGQLTAKRLDDAAISVLALRIALARVPQPDVAVVGSAEHQELAAKVRAGQ